jgi:hypothetical protein
MDAVDAVASSVVVAATARTTNAPRRLFRAENVAG